MTCRGPCPCGKRSFGSVDQARKAHRAARWRIRVYLCELCHRYHVANGDKR